MRNKSLLVTLLEIDDVRSGSAAPYVTGVENEEVAKIDRARGLMKSLITDQDFDRQDVLDNLMQSLNITLSTATSYFQRIAKEMGLTNIGSGDGQTAMTAGDDDTHAAPAVAPEANPSVDEDPPEPEIPVPESDNPDRQGVIRVIPNAHMIYKRQNDEGNYDELWIYNIGDKMSDELKIRRAILAGTDIPPRRQTSEDGSQEYRLTTIGNAQMMEIRNLPQ